MAIRDRWQVKLPERNWRRWWWAYGLHGATGCIAAGGTTIAVSHGEVALAAPFLWLSAMVLWRQYLGFLRKNDTPGRDVGDHMIGFVLGLAAGVAAGYAL